MKVECVGSNQAPGATVLYYDTSRPPFSPSSKKLTTVREDFYNMLKPKFKRITPPV